MGARRAAILVCCALFFFIQHTAWICDDALITMRSVVNFVGGDGISWHAGERMQAFTHPLWFFCLSAAHALAVPTVVASVVLGLAFSAMTLFVLFFRMGRTTVWSVLVAGFLLLGSRGFVDYSTSGLENSLGGLLLALLFSRLRRVDSDRFVPVCAGLLLLNRLDSIFLLAPILWWWQADAPTLRRRELLWFTAGPPLLWLAFSLVYFGAPFPNPYYAKLHAGLPRLDYLRRGAAYFVNSAWHDSSTVLALCLSVLAALRMRGLAAAVGLGIVLQCGYVLWVGGDFMLSRFFFLPVVAAAGSILLTSGLGVSLRRFRGVLLLACMASAVPALLAQLELPAADESQEEWQQGGRGGRMHWGIADERRWYAFEYGLHSAHRRWPRLHWNEAPSFEEIRVIEGGAGLLGISGTDRVRLLDRTGLVDPFLARLRAEPDPLWRVGHAFRALPPGYEESRATGENRLEDPQLAILYDRLNLAATAPLFDSKRLRAIAALLPASLFGRPK